MKKVEVKFEDVKRGDFIFVGLWSYPCEVTSVNDGFIHVWTGRNACVIPKSHGDKIWKRVAIAA